MNIIFTINFVLGVFMIRSNDKILKVDIKTFIKQNDQDIYIKNAVSYAVGLDFTLTHVLVF